MQIRLPKEASSETGPTCQQTMTSSSNVGSTSICRGLATRLLLQIIWQFQKTCSDAFTPISSLTSHQLSPLLYACVSDCSPKKATGTRVVEATLIFWPFSRTPIWLFYCCHHCRVLYTLALFLLCSLTTLMHSLNMEFPAPPFKHARLANSGTHSLTIILLLLIYKPESQSPFCFFFCY